MTFNLEVTMFDPSVSSAGQSRPLTDASPGSQRTEFSALAFRGEQSNMGAARPHVPFSVVTAGWGAVQVYDRIEIPKVEPDVTRVTLRGGVCPCCARRFKAPAPVGLEPGSPFGPNLRAFVIYLRSVQGIPMARLSDVLKDLFDLDISEGALVNILEAARKPFAAQTNLIKQRLLSGTALASDETGMRVGKANWWLWVFHHGDSAALSGRRVHPQRLSACGRPHTCSFYLGA